MDLGIVPKGGRGNKGIYKEDFSPSLITTHFKKQQYKEEHEGLNPITYGGSVK